MVMSVQCFTCRLVYRMELVFVIYESIQDMKQKILYYLKNEDKRRSIARAGRDVALKYHMPW